MNEDLYYFDEESADRVCRFFEKFLHHWKGEHAGKLFQLLEWERYILRQVFGWKRKKDGTRRYRFAYIECPRKTGKSFFASGIALYLTCADNEPGAEVYSMACTTSQASITFENAKQMVSASPPLSKRIIPRRWHLEHPASKSTYKALSGERTGKHGLSVHGLIADEIHEYGPSEREVFSAMQTSMGHRRQPLTVCITTAGHGGDQTLCRELHEKAVQYLTGQVKPGDAEYDDTFFPVIHAADPNDDWQAEATWHKAIPGLGHTVSLDFIRREAIKAASSPAYLNEFLRLYLNVWTEQATRWLDLDLWDSRTGNVDLEALAGQPVICGLDTSQSYDLTAVVLIFPTADTWLVYPYLYAPRDTINRRSRDEGLHYRTWADAGHLIETPGSTTDFDRIEAQIIELASKYQILEVAYDPYNATSLVNHLEQAGITTVPVYQQYKEMSPAAKEIERRLVNGNILIHKNPVMRYCASNVEVESDKHGNIRPVKPQAKGKYAGTKQFCIDGIVAMIIAARRASLMDEPQTFDVTSLVSSC